jgi:hypothetical protein
MLYIAFGIIHSVTCLGMYYLRIWGYYCIIFCSVGYVEELMEIHLCGVN